MGLFDMFKKMGKDIVDNTLQDLKKEVNSKLGFEPAQSNTNTHERTYAIPEAYNQFPTFDGKISKLSEKDESKYIRCTTDYNDVSEGEFNNYVSKVVSSGYEKATDVRYDKDNTYIIIERYSNNRLHLVFHIKK